ncbi:MAG: GTP cyclohydrolase IIa [Desulfurococcales archaeon]|nr:GTP cyclohydrolase IIa [Desulfurococcales archaeon]
MAEVRLAVIEFVGYREWTESLGSDREWLIQIIQSEMYALAQRRAAEAGAHVLPMRYDYMMLLASNVGEDQLATILDSIKENSQVPVRMASACGPTPMEAEMRAWNLLRETSPGKLSYNRCSGDERVALAHIDIDNITAMTRKMGATRTYYIVVDLLQKIAEKAGKHGSIVQYLGGDNILAVLPPNSHRHIVEELISFNGIDLKAGVGYAPTARTALSLAAEALHEIRTGAPEKIVYKSRE